MRTFVTRDIIPDDAEASGQQLAEIAALPSVATTSFFLILAGMITTYLGVVEVAEVRFLDISESLRLARWRGIRHSEASTRPVTGDGTTERPGRYSCMR
jgi:hypothetical protein